MRNQTTFRRVGFWAVIVVWVMAVGRASAQNDVPYQSESGSWSLVKPGTWNPIGFAVMKEVEAQNREDYPDKNFKYVAGFTRGGMNTFNYPYVFLNVTDADLSGLSYADIEMGLSITKPKGKREALLHNAVAQFAWGDTVVDSDRGRTVSTIHLKGGRKGPVRLTVYSYLGAHNVVQLECYELEANGNKNDHYVRDLVDTFKFSEGNGFVPTAGLSNSGGAGPVSKTGAIFILGGLGGLVVLGVMLALIAKALKK